MHVVYGHEFVTGMLQERGIEFGAQDATALSCCTRQRSTEVATHQRNSLSEDTQVCPENSTWHDEFNDTDRVPIRTR